METLLTEPTKTQSAGRGAHEIYGAGEAIQQGLPIVELRDAPTPENPGDATPTKVYGNTVV